MRFLVIVLFLLLVCLSKQDLRKFYNANWDESGEFTGNVFCDGHLASLADRPKIAYCLSGGARTLPDKRVYASMRKNLIEALGGEPRVFAALRLEDVPPKGQRDYDFSSVSVSDMAELEEAFSPDMLNPSTVSYLPAVSEAVKRAERNEISSECETGFVKIPQNRGRMVGMFESIGKCFELVEEYERDHDMTFDWVVRVRPDSVWTSAVQPYCFWHLHDAHQVDDGGKEARRGDRYSSNYATTDNPKDLYYFFPGEQKHLWCDLFYMVRRDVAFYAMNPLAWYEQCKGRQNLLNAEAFLKKAFQEPVPLDKRPSYLLHGQESEVEGTSIEAYNFPMTILRNPDTCHEYSHFINGFDKNVLPQIESRGRVEDVLCYPEVTD